MGNLFAIHKKNTDLIKQINVLIDDSKLGEVPVTEEMSERLTDVKSEEFDISEFFNDLINEMSILLKPGQGFQFKHLGQTHTYTDSNLLKHVMINLISNAIKFSPENSIISIEAEVNTKTTLIKITDNGIGIPVSDQVHLFERFFRAKNAINIQGTGLGLNIIVKYLEALEGKIHFKSKLNVGTTFVACIPNA
jgi:signal transduction histidine kinase